MPEFSVPAHTLSAITLMNTDYIETHFDVLGPRNGTNTKFEIEFVVRGKKSFRHPKAKARKVSGRPPNGILFLFPWETWHLTAKPKNPPMIFAVFLPLVDTKHAWLLPSVGLNARAAQNKCRARGEARYDSKS